jgi:hypothetical protein
MAQPDLIFEFPARYQLDVIKRIEPRLGIPIYVFPDAVAPLAQDRSIPQGVLIRVTAAEGKPWIGVFPPGEQRHGPHQPSILGAPDELSFWVVNKGMASVVRSDDPLINDFVPALLGVTGFAVAPEYELVLFTDIFDLFAYGPDGAVFKSERLAEDDLTVRRVEGREVILHGFFGAPHEIAVDLETWNVRELPRTR